jgi:DNA invertase Pin-like site-specific DNA recombinase
MSLYVSYVRVSTKAQGLTGLGIASQKEIVNKYVADKGALIGEYIEIESGKNNHRPELALALRQCEMSNATLVIAKLDRLSRNAVFLLKLKESKINFVCCDMPFADSLTIGIMSILAQKERELISIRTKDALAVVKASGVKMGGAAHDKATGLTEHKQMTRNLAKIAVEKRVINYDKSLFPYLKQWLSEGLSCIQIAERLNQLNFAMRSNRRGNWSSAIVERYVKDFRKKGINI